MEGIFRLIFEREIKNMVRILFKCHHNKWYHVNAYSSTLVLMIEDKIE